MSRFNPKQPKQIIDDLMPVQVRKMVDYLYDGHLPVFGYLMQVKQWAGYRNNQVLVWLCKNKLRGAKLVEFFQNEKDTDKGMSVLNGVTYIFNKIDGSKKKVREITLDEDIDRYNKSK